MAKKRSRGERRVRRSRKRSERNKQRREQYRKRVRNKRLFNYALLSLGVIAVLTAVYTVGRTTVESGMHDALAHCLTEKGAVMYGTDWCPHCQNQKRLFGKSFRYVNYVNCDVNKEACGLAGVKGYPTWTFSDGSSVSGVQQLDVLMQQTGCTDES